MVFGEGKGLGVNWHFRRPSCSDLNVSLEQIGFQEINMALLENSADQKDSVTRIVISPPLLAGLDG